MLPSWKRFEIYAFFFLLSLLFRQTRTDFDQVPLLSSRKRGQAHALELLPFTIVRLASRSSSTARRKSSKSRRSTLVSSWLRRLLSEEQGRTRSVSRNVAMTIVVIRPIAIGHHVALLLNGRSHGVRLFETSNAHLLQQVVSFCKFVQLATRSPLFNPRPHKKIHHNHAKHAGPNESWLA